jgi:hypothetical protein
MNIRAVTLGSASLLLAALLAAREKTDVIVMENGDRMTGEIKSLSAGVLYVSLDYVDGTIQVQWSKVARLTSSQLFIVQTRDGSLYTSTLATAESPGGQPMTLTVTEATKASVALARSGVVGIQETSEAFRQSVSGDINLGLVYSKGNNSTQYNVGSEVGYLRERWGAGGTFSSSLSSNAGSETSTRNQLNLKGYHLLPRRNNYFYEGFCGFLQSSVQGIKLQSTLGGGIGRYLKNTDRIRFTVVGGLAWQNTHYRQSAAGLATENVAAGVLATELTAFKFNKTNLSITAALFPSISGPSRVRFNTNASYYIKLFSNLSWNLSFYGNWDTRPPADFQGADYGSSSGITWTFGYK